MRSEVMAYYGFTKPLEYAGYYETQHHRQILSAVRDAVLSGHLIAVCGVVGSGKTVMMRRLRQQLTDENITVSKSLSVDKQSVKLATLIAALFYDLGIDRQMRIPTQGERRERDLRDLIKQNKQPVVLFIDEAHDLNLQTLIGLKRLTEVIEDGGGRLSVVLAGHPKLQNDLRRPSMEEIGLRTRLFTWDGIAGSQREYLAWLLEACGQNEPESVLAAETVDTLVTKLRTPLQIQQYLTLALETGHRMDERPISAPLLESVLSRQLDDLEPTLARNGYRVKNLVEQFDVKAAEVRALFSGRLDPKRTIELQDRMLAAGVPLCATSP